VTTIQKVFAFGCVGALITGGVVAGVVVGNWQRLKGTYQGATEVLAVASALQAKFNTFQVSVMTSGESEDKTLMIGMVNPPFLEGADGEQLRAKAKEVATAARELYPSRDSIYRYDVAFSKQSALVFSTTHRFKFLARDLPVGEPR
jgi:hypothetical protein